jgi:hypothetical protein
MHHGGGAKSRQHILWSFYVQHARLWGTGVLHVGMRDRDI